MDLIRCTSSAPPTLQAVAKDTATVWQTLVFSHWYGYEEKTMQVATGTALWYHAGKPPVAIRWVLLKDPQGKLETSARLSTDLTLTDEQIGARHLDYLGSSLILLAGGPWK